MDTGMQIYTLEHHSTVVGVVTGDSVPYQIQCMTFGNISESI